MTPFSTLAPGRFLRLLSADAKNVSRDPVLLFALFLCVLLTLTFILTRQLIDEAALNAFGLPGFSRYLGVIVLGLPAALIGWVTGFLILEDRDDGPLLAMDVTPLGKSGFVLHRASVTLVIAVAFTLLAAPFVMPGLPGPAVFILAIFIGLEAVMLALAVPALARNKVEGLAITKVLNIMALVPLLSLVPSPLRYLAAPIPSLWVGELLEISPQPYLSIQTITVLGLIIHALALWFIQHRLMRNIG